MKLSSRRANGWAWEFQAPGGEWLLCRWAAPYRSVLRNEPDAMPADGARMIRVELVPTSKAGRIRYGYTPSKKPKRKKAAR